MIKQSAMRRILLTLLLALSPAAAMASPVRWTLTVDGDGAVLSDGEGDDASVRLSCMPEPGKLHVYVQLQHREAVKLRGEAWVNAAGRPAPWRTPLNLRSGTASAVMSAEADDNEDSGGTDVYADLPTGGPVLSAFARSGALTLVAYGETVKVGPVAPAKAARLLRVCSN